MATVYVGFGPGPTEAEWSAQVADGLDLQDAVGARWQALTGALDRLRVIEAAARTNAGLRGVDPWTRPQRLMVLDAIADLAQACRWLGQQHVAPGDLAD